jgi:hypothetical protein
MEINDLRFVVGVRFNWNILSVLGRRNDPGPSEITMKRCSAEIVRKSESESNDNAGKSSFAEGSDNFRMDDGNWLISTG